MADDPHYRAGLCMSPTEYRQAIEALGLSQTAAARFLCISPGVSARYAMEGAPGPASIALRLLAAAPEHLRERWKRDPHLIG